MPRYKVLSPGYMNDILHKPDHHRHGFVVTDKALKPVPSWLELVKPETAAQKKSREKADADDQEQVKEDKKDIDAASFMSKPGDAVEVLG